jgi:hypothetical protein
VGKESISGGWNDYRLDDRYGIECALLREVIDRLRVLRLKLDYSLGELENLS